ncbi:MAG: DUF1643 domain-containing protein [Bacteroidetes bacterium]|nr:DUF1643 domain-containing protein [Bacteroidota bacterium]
MKQILNGKVYAHQVGKWIISWESDGNYRHWCYQKHPSNNKDVLVVMLNPGSLSGDGKNLTKDTTLRILREVFGDTGCNPFIVNLFDLATPSTAEFFKNWENRDSKLLVYSKLKEKNYCGIIYAYGDYEQVEDQGLDILKRIKLVRGILNYLPEINLPKNNSGSPKHPILWQRQKIKAEIKTLIKKFAQNVA